MKGKKKRIWSIVLAFSLIAGIFVGVGYSNYIVNYDKVDTKDSEEVSANPSQQEEMVKVDFKYQIANGTKTTYGDSEAVGTVNGKNYGLDNFSFNGNKNNPCLDEYNEFQSLMKALIGFELGDVSEGEYYYSGIGQFDGYQIVLNVHQKIEKKHHNGFLGFGAYDYCVGSYSIAKRKMEEEVDYFYSTGVEFSLILPKGEVLSRNLVSQKLKQLEPNYTFVGFKKNADDNNFLEDDFRMETDSVIYIFLNNNEGMAENKNSLSNTINELDDNTSATFNALRASGEYNITNDLSYFSPDNAVFLTQKTTIKEGVTVNFGLNDGDVTKKGELNSSNFEPEIGHHLQYQVILQEDLVIDGTLVIGASYGASASNAAQGLIEDEYVCLDLNGHNITINSSGQLYSYGLIKDSVGSGCIFVNGGQLQTLVTIQDYRGGSATLGMYNSRTFPFQVYSLPYLRCHIRFGRDSEGKIGRFLALAYLCLGTSGVTAIGEPILYFVGPEGDSTRYLFSIENSNDSNSFVDVYGYSPKNIISEESTSDKNAVLSWRTKIVLHNVQCKMNSIEIDMGNYFIIFNIKIETEEYIFPIPGFFDILLESSKLELSSRIKFLPGSSFIADENSVVGLSYSGDYCAQISFLDRNYYYYDSESEALVTNDNASGTVATWGQAYLTSKAFAKYFTGSRFKIYGTLAFDERNNSGKPYVLSGYLDFNKIATFSNGLDNLTYIDYGKKENPFSKITGITIRTYNFSTLLGGVSDSQAYFCKGYALPLISRGFFYADGKVGAWNESTGEMVCDGKTYILDCTQEWSQNDSGDCSLLEVTYDESTHKFSSNGKQYIYFAGMYCEIDSSNVADTKRLNPNTPTTVVAFDSNAHRWLRS